MSEDVEAGASAAARALGDEASVDAAADAGEAVATDHSAAEGTAPSSPSTRDLGSSSTWREMLLSTDPAPSLAETDDPWNPEQGGSTRIYRGLMKATGVDGLPAVVDVVIGIAELAQSLNLHDDEQSESDGNADDPEQGDDDDVDPTVAEIKEDIGI